MSRPARALPGTLRSLQLSILVASRPTVCRACSAPSSPLTACSRLDSPRWLSLSAIRSTGSPSYISAAPPGSSNGSSSSSNASSSSSTKRPPPPPERRKAIDIALISLGVVALSSVIYLGQQRYASSKATSPSALAAAASSSTSPTRSSQLFTVPLQGETGDKSGSGTTTATKATSKTLAMLSAEETDRRLAEHAQSFSVGRAGNPLYRYDTSFLASNDPIEDDSCSVILSRDASSKKTGDLMLFAVFDGHSGWQTSKYLSEHLLAYVGRELNAVFAGEEEYAKVRLASLASSSSIASDGSKGNDEKGKMDRVWSFVTGSNSKTAQDTFQLDELDSDPNVTKEALRNAFRRLDSDIVNAPIKLLESTSGKGKLNTTAQAEALQTLLPALSGSCALLAFVDTANNRLQLAVAGDSRAVMGTSVGKGVWKAEVLTEDQTGKNPKEVKRMQAEHPASERDSVIMRGRVLGGLEPTRAMGDSRYKWPVGMQEKLLDAFYPGQGRYVPRNYLTPPYVTADPVVSTFDLPAKPSKGSTRRFVVMATDGLWDQLSNEEVVGLVGAYLDGERRPQTQSAVVKKVRLSDTGIISPHVPRQTPQRGAGPSYVFEDANIATHLIRNALGGANSSTLQALMSIPAPISRRYRDDITVTVLLFGAEDDQVVEGVRKNYPRSKL
ncbi:uncharacterized protein L969DRAFT_100456 [Mixia osmundae IAM 14324]|uniref:uncharacterized protein n=1 Tax=Mixia osmundae (strain CBS 9802 / IAM 14324 / JCM 22182 / KY 12970) TaxID=764103 RepID=UPI0004A54C62|nr:uncharacterized protein L969DRAFT_100456 [Mixia osmundae IAM 14324]KEI41908.1 hypothetical protein L969DRAFT_100456 [Mixia osmundae IAM 14324]